MKTQLHIFLTALMFYTRIPCPIQLPHSPEYLNKASRYFPLIGWIVGAMCFAVFWASYWLFGVAVAVALAMVAGVLVTGAFHEDGLADCADGFGGGWQKQKILDIMKDSRVGAFGAIALVLLFLVKFAVLSSLITASLTSTNADNSMAIIALFFISHHAVARLTAINLVFISTYSRDDATSKVKPIAKTHGLAEIVGAYCFGLLPLAVLVYMQWQFVAVLPPLIFLCWYAKYYFEKWIHGYTGDCLGAVEQLAECVSLLALLAVVRIA